MQRIDFQPAIITIGFLLILGSSAIWAAAHDSGAAAQVQVRSLAGGAITALHQKAMQHPRDDRCWVELGQALMQRARETGSLGDYRQGRSAFKTAFQLNPENSTAMIGMAWVHGALHQFEASIQWANKAIASDPEASDAYGLLGDAAVERGDYDAAFGHYQKMLDIRPDLASYSRGAHLLFVTGDLQSAITLMRKAIAAGAPFAENTAWCRAELARMLLRQGALQEAERVIRSGLEQTPHNYQLLAVMGQIQAARK